MDALARLLKEIPGVEVVLAALGQGAGEAMHVPWLTGRFCNASRKRFDAFQPSGQAEGACRWEALRVAGCGVILWCAERREAEALEGFARYGILSVRFGKGNRAIPFWDEVAEGKVTSHTTIFWHETTLTEGRAVRNAETSTKQGLFLTEAMQPPLVAAMRMLAGLCLDMRDMEIRGSGEFVERVKRLPLETLRPNGEEGYPSNGETARFISTKLAQSASLRWTAREKRLKWFIALRPNMDQTITGSSPDLSGFRDLALPENVAEMADPFLWEHGEKQYLLFEEIGMGRTNGRLACAELKADGLLGEMRILLEKPYHLSYPCVVAANGELYLLPESSQAKRVDLYRFRRFPWEMELVATPLQGVGVVDTTPVEVDGVWYIFTTTREPFLETLLFTASRLDGPWTLHPANPVSTSVRSSRSAGQLFRRNGKLFRPAQDCSVRYGYGMTINEVTRLTRDEFAERPVSYLAPSWGSGLLGTHTWNESSTFQVVDGMRYA